MPSKGTVVGRILPHYHERDKGLKAGHWQDIETLSTFAQPSAASALRGPQAGELTLLPLWSVISEAAPGHRPGDRQPFSFSDCSQNKPTDSDIHIFKINLCSAWIFSFFLSPNCF